MLKLNTVSGVQDDVTLIVDYHSIGRALSGANYDLDQDCLTLEWNMLKVSDSKLISFYEDYENCLLSVPLLYGLYLLVDGYNYNKSSAESIDRDLVLVKISYTSRTRTGSKILL